MSWIFARNKDLIRNISVDILTTVSASLFFYGIFQLILQSDCDRIWQNFENHSSSFINPKFQYNN